MTLLWWTHDLVLPCKPAEQVTPAVTLLSVGLCGFTGAGPVAGAGGTGCAHVRARSPRGSAVPPPDFSWEPGVR